jgi:hypothetical protein
MWTSFVFSVTSKLATLTSYVFSVTSKLATLTSYVFSVTSKLATLKSYVFSVTSKLATLTEHFDVIFDCVPCRVSLRSIRGQAHCLLRGDDQLLSSTVENKCDPWDVEVEYFLYADDNRSHCLNPSWLHEYILSPPPPPCSTLHYRSFL